MIRLKLTLAYSGTRFHGWQVQEHHTAHRPRTVQACVEEAFRRVLAGGPVRVRGASRTDAGVHAEGQVAHVDIPADKARIDWQTALNALLPSDVAVLAVEAALLRSSGRFCLSHKFSRFFPDYLNKRFGATFLLQAQRLDQAGKTFNSITSFENLTGFLVESFVHRVGLLGLFAKASQTL